MLSVYDYKLKQIWEQTDVERNWGLLFFFIFFAVWLANSVELWVYGRPTSYIHEIYILVVKESSMSDEETLRLYFGRPIALRHISEQARKIGPCICARLPNYQIAQLLGCSPVIENKNCCKWYELIVTWCLICPCPKHFREESSLAYQARFLSHKVYNGTYRSGAVVPQHHIELVRHVAGVIMGPALCVRPIYYSNRSLQARRLHQLRGIFFVCEIDNQVSVCTWARMEHIFDGVD